MFLTRAAQHSLALADKHSCGLLLCVTLTQALPMCVLPTPIAHNFKGGPLGLKIGQLTFLCCKVAPTSALHFHQGIPFMSAHPLTPFVLKLCFDLHVELAVSFSNLMTLILVCWMVLASAQSPVPFPSPSQDSSWFLPVVSFQACGSLSPGPSGLPVRGPSKGGTAVGQHWLGVMCSLGSS